MSQTSTFQLPSQHFCKHPIKQEALIDRDGKRREALFTLPESIQHMIIPMLNDPRDVLITMLQINIGVVVLPAVFYFFLFSSSHLFGLVHLATVYFLFVQRFMLMLHFSEHRFVYFDLLLILLGRFIGLSMDG